METRVEDAVFWEELPIPGANLQIYREIYFLEQWLRRIAYAALIAKFGANWPGALPADLASSLKKRLRQLSGRVHLDSENSDNAIWLLTLDELQRLLLSDATWPMVKQLTTLPQGLLESKISEIREIRNVVGHSRAAGPRTVLIAEAAAASLRVGIDHFKGELLYDKESRIHLGNIEKDPAEGAPTLYAEFLESGEWPCFQSMLSESEFFFALTRLPFEPFGTYLAVRQFLDRFQPLAHDALAILVNKQGEEFTVVWPKDADQEVHQRILRFFFEHHDYAWTETPYELQSPSAICNPWIWFYENERPRRV
ncbi:MAG: hypothetical protein ACTHK6_07500 [Solirubrobacterales bacterium]